MLFGTLGTEKEEAVRETVHRHVDMYLEDEVGQLAAQRQRLGTWMNLTYCQEGLAPILTHLDRGVNMQMRLAEGKT